MTDERAGKLGQLIARLNTTLKQEVMPILTRLPAYGRLVYALTTSTTISLADKSALFIAIGYQLSPVDLIPGFIPVIGQLDDLLVLLWAIRRTLDLLPPERAEEVLMTIGLPRAQIDADTAVVRRALRETVSRSMRAAQRGATAALGAGITAATYLGFFTYYALRGNRKRG